MKRIMNWLVPKEEKFFELLAKQSENALKAAEELKEFVRDYEKSSRSERKSKSNSMKSIERKGDEIAHDIMEKLDTTFITPIDKEDIHRMTVLLDDVVDLIDTATLRFVILGIERIDNHIIKLVSVTHQSVEELNKAVADLKKLKHVKEHYVKIHSLENEADEVYYNALSELFHFFKNPIDIIKYKEVYELLEGVTDKCEDVANVIESIVIKHA
ncbi:MAG TPA: DUF47 family protein [Candidatus Nanoarchaeia archaeon]|nr:DUF47 family protein [Candidatus Nanoarchaeia archaeon]